MAEYLKRDDVLSNADIITVQTREYGTIDVVPVEYLADLPTADVVEVVRCKDCTYRYTKACGAKHERADMDFCSHGLRKEGARVDESISV